MPAHDTAFMPIPGGKCSTSELFGLDLLVLPELHPDANAAATTTVHKGIPTFTALVYRESWLVNAMASPFPYPEWDYRI
jgi:hypothetical protein